MIQRTSSAMPAATAYSHSWTRFLIWAERAPFVRSAQHKSSKLSIYTMLPVWFTVVVNWNSDNNRARRNENGRKNIYPTIERKKIKQYTDRQKLSTVWHYFKLSSMLFHKFDLTIWIWGMKLFSKEHSKSQWLHYATLFNWYWSYTSHSVHTCDDSVDCVLLNRAPSRMRTISFNLGYQCNHDSTISIYSIPAFNCSLILPKRKIIICENSRNKPWHINRNSSQWWCT